MSLNENEPAGSVKQQRESSTLRRYLQNLPEVGNAKRGVKSLDDWADAIGAKKDDLVAFRDGNQYSLPSTSISLFVQLIGRGTMGMPGYEFDDSMGNFDYGVTGPWGSLEALELNRIAKLRTFNLIDTTRGEANSALNCYADLGVTGNIGETSRFTGGFEPTVFEGAQTSKDAFAADAAHINQNLFPDDQKWLAFRGMAKFGGQFGEIGLGMKKGRQYIDRFRSMNARTMCVHRGENGEYDPNYAYKQCIPGQLVPIAQFPEWQICHFKNEMDWGGIYGKSIFDGGLRAWMQLEAMEQSMIIRRMERAGQRYKFTIDTGMVDGGDDGCAAKLEHERNRFKKRKTLDHNRNMRNQSISLPPNEDIFIAKRDDKSPADVEILNGDEYIEAIGDVEYFRDMWLAKLGPPKAHLGIESEGSKTGVNDLHIVFARKVRAMQLKFVATGLNHLYWVSMVLRGIDPRSVRYVIFPPGLGTRDELIASQVMLAHATSIQYLAKAFGQSGKQPSIQWFLKYVMGFDDEVVQSLDLPGMISKVVVQQPGGAGAGFKNDPAKNGPKSEKEEKEFEEMADVAVSQPSVANAAMIAEYLVTERRIQMRDPKIIPQLWESQSRMTKPFANNFDEVVRSLGITQLRKFE